jgi:hypothetical protein
MLYKDIEVDIAITNYSDGVAIIPFPDEVVCIPEDGATLEELEIIRQIKEDVAGRPVVEPEPVVAPPTAEERLAALEDKLAQSEVDNIIALEALAELYEIIIAI